MRRQTISACVITHNRSALVGTCLRALAFADEVILVDKGSTDDTRRVAAGLADRIVRVPWSPTVEESRAHAVSLCRHPWVLLLDDDECLNRAAVRFIQAELEAPRADIYAFPLRHYILGVHDERAYYWPEHHVRLFRREAVAFGTTVHAGMRLRSPNVMQVAAEADGPCIHHLSHPDVASWIERTNRYTGRADRARVDGSGDDLAAFAHARIEHWLACGRGDGTDDYPAAVALLRAIYDMVDRLKTWEEARGLGAPGLFREICARLDAEHGPIPPYRGAPGWRRRWARWWARACPATRRQPAR